LPVDRGAGGRGEALRYIHFFLFVPPPPPLPPGEGVGREFTPGLLPEPLLFAAERKAAKRIYSGLAVLPEPLLFAAERKAALD